MEANLDIRRQSLATKAKWGIGAGVALIAAPTVFVLAQALVGAVVAAVGAFIIGSTAITFAPVWSMKLANWKLKAIVGEATANPIETLQNLYIEHRKELEAKGQAIIDFEAEVGNFDDQLADFRKRPDCADEVPRYEEISKRMHEGLATMKQCWTDFKTQVDDLAHKIEKAQAIYKMACAAQRVTALSGSAQSQVFDEIKQRVALDSVRTSMNRSFAALNQAIESRQRATLSAGGAQ